ncbi:uncharacterized protein K460DRAFT_402898 [Cucurbitaria berberidis CBS 394.84]|uniref:Uncharacterized protein n=1 Tax=Cucurbitaria berberidis CBS 394.84 TaxID=1168544 RepID=A0A9P4LAU4_9PLEO|nr:uncharacterized protein K460DRAFT_402898 [Cucurbitaria berberidis CBS 394.84]KAF1847549.1 hypothetical protein K460DRAFT_402898 [Cucurbitaria berberidis CBS 394.84]
MSHEVPNNTLQKLRNAIGHVVLDELPGIGGLVFELDSSNSGYHPVTFRMVFFEPESDLEGYEAWAYFNHPTTRTFMASTYPRGARVDLKDEFDSISFDDGLSACKTQVSTTAKYLLLFAAEAKVGEVSTHNIPYSNSSKRELITICDILHEENEQETRSKVIRPAS